MLSVGNQCHSALDRLFHNVLDKEGLTSLLLWLLTYGKAFLKVGVALAILLSKDNDICFANQLLRILCGKKRPYVAI